MGTERQPKPFERALSVIANPRADYLLLSVAGEALSLVQNHQVPQHKADCLISSYNVSREQIEQAPDQPPLTPHLRVVGLGGHRLVNG